MRWRWMLGTWLLSAAATVAVAEEPARSGPQLTRAPELVTFVEAPFPPEEAGRTASVVLAITIAADGSVEDAVVQESAGSAFDAAAVAAAKQFRFTPAEIDGVPGRIRILYRYDFVERVELPTTGFFSGVVRDRETKQSLVGVRLELADGREVVTDAEGRFDLRDLPPGPMGITISGEQITTLSLEETFVAGERLEAVYDIFLNDPDEEADDMEILVVAPALRRQAVSTEVGAEEARKVPGTQGDVLRVVENLPGVARAGLGTGALVVWGATPEETGVYIDGVRVPRLYHDGGLRSVVGSELVKSVELVPGGFGAAWGRGTGGLVSVTTQTLEGKEGVHGAVSADLYDASATLVGEIKERVTYGISGRYSYVGPLLNALYPGVGDFFPVPQYYDVQGRIGVRLRPNERLDLTVLASGDRTQRTAPAADPAREASDERRLDFQRVMLKYQRDLGDGRTVSAVAFAGAERQDRVERFGDIETAIRQRGTMGGLRASFRARPIGFLTVEVGLDSELSRTEVDRQGALALPAREGDVRVFGQPPPDQINRDTFTVWQLHAAPYVEADVGVFGDKLHVVAGLRLDPYARSISRSAPQVGISPTHGLFQEDVRVEPRLALRFAPSKLGYVQLAAGQYGQMPSAADLSASFGNPTLPISRGRHLVLGGGVAPHEAVSVDVTAFYTATSDLAMRNGADQPARAEALVASGSGRNYGAQIMARVTDLGPFTGWISYTLAWAQRRNADDLAWRPSDYDQRHVFTALGTFELPLRFEAGLRARVATGYPRTEVSGAWYDNRRDLYQPLFGEQNQIRLPVFFQADLRVAKTFEVRASEIEVYLDVQNITNQKNVEEFIYAADYSERGGIVGLPTLPVLGIRWSF